MMDDKFFVVGSLKYHKQGEEIRNFVQERGFEVVELANRPLLDVGSLVFF